MRIALCAQAFRAPLAGGVDVYADRLARALLRLGHEPQILALDPEGVGPGVGPEIEAGEGEGWEVRRIKFRLDERSPESFAKSYDPKMLEPIRRCLLELNPDLLLVMNFYLPTFAAVEAAQQSGIPVVHIATDFVPVCRRGTFIRWHGKACTVGESVKTCAACYVSHRPLGHVGAAVLNRLPESTLVEWADRTKNAGDFQPLRLIDPYLRQIAVSRARLDVLRTLRRQIELVFVPTGYTEQIFLENGFSADQVRLLPFGVETRGPFAALKKVKSPHTRFLFVGRLQPYKGAHLLVDAFSALGSPSGAKLMVYGKADGYEEYFTELLRKMDSNPDITFGGQIAPSDLPKAFEEADYFILPSIWHENSPLILLDALQSSTPVIASKVGGVTDLVSHETNGLVFPMGDADALRRTLQRAIEEPELKASLSRARELPSIDSYADNMLRELSASRASEGDVNAQAIPSHPSSA